MRKVAGQNGLGSWDFDALPAWTCPAHRLAYATWAKALIMCGFVTNDRRDKSEADATIREVMSLIITAQEQLWADVRISGGV